MTFQYYEGANEYFKYFYGENSITNAEIYLCLLCLSLPVWDYSVPTYLLHVKSELFSGSFFISMEYTGFFSKIYLISYIYESPFKTKLTFSWHSLLFWEWHTKINTFFLTLQCGYDICKCFPICQLHKEPESSSRSSIYSILSSVPLLFPALRCTLKI